MKAPVLVHPFLAIRELWLTPREDRQFGAPALPEPPPMLRDEPAEPEREYLFWTYFIVNPRPKS